MAGPSELDQQIWAIVGATRVFEGPFTFADAALMQSYANRDFPTEKFYVTTADAATRALANEPEL